MQDKLILIKEVHLKNNCPECYSKEGLILSFKQRFIETKFKKSITTEVKHEIDCRTCNTSIYPVQWTDDIERVVAYQKKAFIPKKASTFLKKMLLLAL
ncbi:hypothetical protein [Thalassobellus citreus]|uniref:hypothetical protein n=1 Tax=Thalassobellus citreus TaxID=3367752 RepID=UPI0037BD31EE